MPAAIINALQQPMDHPEAKAGLLLVDPMPEDGHPAALFRLSR